MHNPECTHHMRQDHCAFCIHDTQTCRTHAGIPRTLEHHTSYVHHTGIKHPVHHLRINMIPRVPLLFTILLTFDSFSLLPPTRIVIVIVNREKCVEHFFLFGSLFAEGVTHSWLLQIASTHCYQICDYARTSFQYEKRFALNSDGTAATDKQWHIRTIATACWWRCGASVEWALLRPGKECLWRNTIYCHCQFHTCKFTNLRIIQFLFIPFQIERLNN